VLEEQGRWDDAEGWYHRALDALTGLKEDAPERWHALLTLHIVARSRGDVEGSVPLLDQAEEAAASAGDEQAAVPFIENARGQLLMARGAYQAAEWAFSTALAAATDARARIVVQLNLAESYLAQRRMLDAAEHAREAEREAIRGAVVPKLPEVYRLLGRIAAAEGDPDAFVLFERALDIVRDRKLPPLEEALTLDSYAEAELARGNADTAAELRQRAETLFASMGKTVKRQRWADVFGPAQDNDLPAQG
jgi:tetratricopeptide (TPR) repeat protein